MKEERCRHVFVPAVAQGVFVCVKCGKRISMEEYFATVLKGNLKERGLCEK